MSDYERDVLESAAGSIVLLHLHGTMIFGVSRAITRKNSEVEGCKSLIVDMKEVNHLGVSSALALEEAMLDMINAGREVYVVGLTGQPRSRFERMGLLQRIPAGHITNKRLVALEKSLYGGAGGPDQLGEVIELPLHKGGCNT
jgi:SulP family sulfate permease